MALAVAPPILMPTGMMISPSESLTICQGCWPSKGSMSATGSYHAWPRRSPSGQGGNPGGDDDQFAETCNVGVNALVDLFNEAFDLAGLPNNIIMLDTFALTKDVIQGNRPDLTHQLDGDPETLDIFYEYELDLQGNPIKRNLTKYGGGFSLDHLHMSHTLNAAMAYEVVDKMNQRLGLSIPLPDLPAIWEADLYNPRKFDPSIQCEFQGICP